jgi:hypothetical protein
LAEAIVGVIFTAMSAAVALDSAPSDIQATRAVDVMIVVIFITVSPLVLAMFIRGITFIVRQVNPAFVKRGAALLWLYG